MNGTKWLLVLICCTSIFSGFAFTRTTNDADLILFNGKVWTVDAAMPWRVSIRPFM